MSKIKKLSGAVMGAVLLCTGLVLALLPGAANAAGRVSGTESFVISETADGSTVVASGLFSGSGSDHSRDMANFDVLHLGQGTLRVRHPDPKSHYTFNVDPTTCVYTVSGKGKYTLHDGTGRFVGVRGYGTYVVSFSGTLARNADGTCNMDADPTNETGTIQASGPVSLPA